MEKTKIAICFQDLEYRKRFLRCWMHHYEHRYEVYVFADVEELLSQDGHDIVLLEGGDTLETYYATKKEEKIVCLSDDTNVYREGITYLCKYQELYKIEQQIAENVPKTAAREDRGEHKKVIGVFSLDVEIYQLPFCAMLAAEYGEREPSILLDLQMASGLEEAENFSMEMLFSAVTTGNYTKELWKEAILKEKDWDYVSPIKNTQCFIETNKKTYESLIEILEKEFGYRRYIINFGQMFEGCIEWMGQCDEFYLLVSNKEHKSRRENAFIQELKCHGMEQLQREMTRIEIPSIYHSYEPWRELSEKWRWNSVGDQVRLQMRTGG